jgi:hypothetical protein
MCSHRSVATWELSDNNKDVGKMEKRQVELTKHFREGLSFSECREK